MMISPRIMYRFILLTLYMRRRGRGLMFAENGPGSSWTSYPIPKTGYSVSLLHLDERSFQSQKKIKIKNGKKKDRFTSAPTHIIVRVGRYTSMRGRSQYLAIVFCNRILTLPLTMRPTASAAIDQRQKRGLVCHETSHTPVIRLAVPIHALQPADTGPNYLSSPSTPSGGIQSNPTAGNE